METENNNSGLINFRKDVTPLKIVENYNELPASVMENAIEFVVISD